MIDIAGQDRYVGMRLSDAAWLKQSDLQLPLRKSDEEPVRHFLQRLRHTCARRIWLIVRSPVLKMAEVETSPEKHLMGLFGLQELDQLSRRYRLHLYCRPEGPDQQLLDGVVDFAMNRENIFRLEIDIDRLARHWQMILRQSGWHSEGQLHMTQYDDRTSLHHDSLLYALLRPQQTHVSVAFVPFSKAVLALVADEAGLTRTCFIRYGEAAPDQRIQESAAWFNLLDSQGCLPDRPSLQARLSGSKWLALPQAPAVLKEAATQAAQYFQGQRQQFDVALHLEQGSQFQQKVWQMLMNIPFAITRTYEDIALAVHQEDQAEARRLSRAVGSACSANPLPLMIPCHRVIGKDGRLVGFSSGLDIKEYLLTHEIMGIG